ncbi:hypothetical protein BGZ76_000297 [Entomortierella beljakovae]|nr:hypothetical protein BGZ76_000297 [Entomortierella beljakovae]
MLKYVKEGALDLLALTLPSSILESIRQVSEDDFLSTQMSNRQTLPRAKRRNNTQSSWTSSRAVAPNLRSISTISSPATSCLSESSCPTVQLPYEILALIFQYLPASDLFSIVAVSRHWRQIALIETKQVDLSECFPVDCLGLDNEVYSDFDFVYNLFTMFPLISSLVIKDRYMRDRDMRVVTAGILAGKMAFTEVKGSMIGTDYHHQAQLAVAAKLKQADPYPKIQDNNGQQTSTDTPKPRSKILPRTLKEELHEFSRSVATYVLIPQTRKTLKKKILERFERNIEQREVLNHYWMYENSIDPSAYDSLVSSSPFGRVLEQNSNGTRYPLVPMTHYRFSDCCFANDWGAVMDVNKLPMIGLAASISGQGLVVDLEGSYGAPSNSIKTMLAFCFGAHCVLTLDLNFRHTHMELEHVVELLSENPVLFKIDIVDSPAYRSLIQLPALRDLGSVLEQMHQACGEFDENELSECLTRAKWILLDLDKAVTAEEARLESQQPATSSEMDQSTLAPLPVTNAAPVSFGMNDLSMPIQSLARQLDFVHNTSQKNKIRTAKTLLRGVIRHGITGLVNTKDQTPGQTLLHKLAWTNSYYSLLASPAADSLPTPPLHHQPSMNSTKSESPFFSSSLPASSSLSTPEVSFIATHLPTNKANITENSTIAIEEEPQTSALSGLSSLISISSLSSALKLRRLSLPTTMWIPKDSEDIGVGGGSLPTPEPNDGDLQRPFDDDHKVVEESTTVSSNSPNIKTNEPAEKTSRIHIPENHPVAIALRMTKMLLSLDANPNVYNKDGRSAVVCASRMGFQPMESLLIGHGGYSKELIRIRETM